MPPNHYEVLAACRKLGTELKEELALVHDGIDALAILLKRIFDESASKEDIGRLEKSIDALKRFLGLDL
jgi:hypothetical protein